MPYVKRIVIAGPVRETKKMQSSRVHTVGVKRSVNAKETSEKQQKINERVAEEHLRWKINANFGYRDLHVVLHYGDKTRSFETCLHDLALFKRRLSRACAAQGMELKFISTTETKRLTNIHHHLIINRIDPEIIMKAWEGVGWITFQPLDRRGNHGKLANYLMKESRSTMRRAREGQQNIKRFSSSRHLLMPEPKYETVPASAWLEEPRTSEGWILWKDENGESVRTGCHEESGYPWQEYFEINIAQKGWNYVKQSDFGRTADG